MSLLYVPLLFLIRLRFHGFVVLLCILYFLRQVTGL